jgi:tripeptidyl-peptidase I
MSRLFLAFLFLCSIGKYGVQSSASTSELLDTRSQKDTATHVYREGIRRLESRTDIVKMEEMPGNHTHELVFAIQQLNMDKLLLVLEDISDPASKNYGNHMSAAAVAALTSNPAAALAAVEYLNENGATVVSESLYGEYVTATAPVAVWNEVLKTKFFAFHQTQIDGSIEKLVRSEHYHVPVELDDHILCVMNTIQIPLRTSSVQRVPYNPRSPPKIDLANSHFDSQGAPTGYIYPYILREFYNAQNAYGSKVATQAAFGGNSDCFSPKSLQYFQRNITQEPVQPALFISNAFVSDDWRCDSGEGNLDIQYMIAMARGSPTTWWHKSGGLSSWLIEVSNTETPPLVLSISYGADELTVTKNEFDLFDQQAQKLGVRGVTVLVASGDDGVHSSAARYNAAKCGYNPDFPAGSPYVVAVGATSVRPHHNTIPHFSHCAAVHCLALIIPS